MKGDRYSHGLWEASAPAAPHTQPLDTNTRADVAIIGAGFTGLSAALHLAQAGARAVVLEAEEVGYGGSGRNVGLVNAGMWVMPSALTETLGQDYGSRLLEGLGTAPSLVFDLIRRYDIDCEARRAGTLHCAVGASGLREIAERARQWQALGAPVHLLGADETARKTGTRAYRGALLDMRAGTVQPLAYVRGLGAAAMAAGAEVYTNCAVSTAEDTGAQWRLRTKSGGEVLADHLIVATNAYSHIDGPWPQLRQELVPLPYFNMATKPLDESLRRIILPEGQGAWDSRKILSSFRLDAAGRLVFGSVGALRGMGSTIHRDWGRRALARLFPQLDGVVFEYEWYGIIGMTTDAMPHFHKLGRHAVSCSGYNGRGIAPGTFFGKELARLALGQCPEQDMPLPLSPMGSVSFRGVRERFYEYGAQLAHAVGARL